MFKNLFSRHLYSRKNSVGFLFSMLVPFLAMGIVDGNGGSDKNELMDEVLKSLDTKIKEANKGNLSKSDFETFQNELKSQMDGLKLEKDSKEEFNNKHNDLLNRLKEQGIEIAKLSNTQNAINSPKLSKRERVEKMIKTYVNTDMVQEFTQKLRGSTSKLSESDLNKLAETGEIEGVAKIVDITSDYTGNTIAITERSGNVIDAPNRLVNVREILSVTQTDQPNIVGQEVYSWADVYTGSTTMLAENASAAEGSFKVKETTWGVKRIAAFYDLSKRMLRTNGLMWLGNHLAKVLPKKLKFTEDVQLLFGDGAGDNLTGLYAGAQAVDFSGNTYIATSFASIATWNSGAETKVTFAAAHGLSTGDSLTIANATAGAAATSYNKTHTSVVVISTTEVLIFASYVADPNVAANWTGTSANPFADKVDGAQNYDVLIATVGNARYQNRQVNAFIMNPADVSLIELLKDTTERYIGVGRDSGGVLRVQGIPIVSTNAVPVGKYFAGVFDADVVEIAEFTQLSMYMTSDVSYDKTNKVAIIIEEEIIFPIFEPLAIFYGDFATAAAALETP
jgi:HK97 family phage major capsid protein